MPAKESMTWVPNQKRWMKFYRGKSYAVSCRQLGTDATKEASRSAANDWWAGRLASLQVAAPKPQHKLYQEIGKLVSWYQRNGDEGGRLAAHQDFKWADILPPEMVDEENPSAIIDAVIDFNNGEIAKGNTGPNDIATMKDLICLASTVADDLGNTRLWADRLKPVETSKTIGHHAERFLAHKKAKMSLSGWDNLRRYLGKFIAFMGADQSIDSLTSLTWVSYIDHIANLDIQEISKRDIKSAAKSFCDDLIENVLIPRFGKLESKSLRFRVARKKVRTLPVTHIADLYEAGKDRPNNNFDFCSHPGPGRRGGVVEFG